MSDEIDDDVTTFAAPDGADDDGPAPGAQKAGWSDGNVLAGGGPRQRREVSPTTRALFAKAASALKAQVDAGEGADALEVAISDDPEERDLEGAAVDPATPDPAAAKPAGDAAKTPEPAAPSAEIVRAWEEINEQRAAFAAEREEISRLRAENDLDALRDRFVDAPGATAVDLIKRWAPWADEKELREIAIDLVTEISGTVLGVTVDQTAQDRLSRRATDRSVKAWKAAQAREKADSSKREEAEKQAAQERGAIDTINGQIKAAAQQFPLLALEDNPGGEVWAKMKAAYLKDGTKLDFKEVAATLEKEYKTKLTEFFAPRRHLFTAAPEQPPAPTRPNQSVPQGDPSSIRRSRTLTNDQAASVPTGSRTVDTDDAKPFDRRAHRAASLGRLAANVKKQTTP